MRLWPNTNIVKQKIWQPAVRRWSKRGAVLVIGTSLVVIIGGGVVLAQLGGAGHQSSSSDIELQKGLVGWWKLNGNTKDSTPNADNGTNTSATPTADREGTANGAMSFNGTSNYITVTSSNSITLSNTLTLSAWINANSISPSVQSIAVKGQSGVIWDYGMVLYGGALCYRMSGGDLCTSLSVILANQWTLVTITITGGNTANFYINGKLYTGSTQFDAGGSSLYISQSTQPLLFANGNGRSEYFGGSISDLRIYNRALSSTEVTALYNQYNPSLNTNSGENGLIGWWKFSGNAKDSTPSADDGTVNGATLTSDREGEANSAYSFNGSSSYIGEATTASSILNIGTQNWTVSAWIKSSSLSNTQGIAGVWTGNPNYWYMRLDSSNKILFRLQYNGSQSISYSSTATINDNNWHYVAVTLNRAGNITFYIDGLSVGSSDITAFNGENIASASEFDIGNIGSHLSGYYFSGSISDVRIYNRVLTQSEITAQYTSYDSQIELGGSGTSGSVSLGKGLVGYWPLTGNAKDATPYADNGTVYGATLTTDREGRANSAYSFNGTSNYIDIPINLSPTAMTVSLWFNATSLSMVNQRLIANSHTDADYHGFQLMINSGGGSGFFDVGNGSAEGRATWSGSLSTGIWYNYVGIYTGSAVYAYINGVQVAYTAFSGGAIAYGWDVNIGRNPAYAGDFFDGTISDVRFYYRALNTAEIAALYEQYD